MGVSKSDKGPTTAMAEAMADALVGIGAKRVLLYGSVARGDHTEDSDLDLVAIFDDLDVIEAGTGDDEEVRRDIWRESQDITYEVCGDVPCDLTISDRVSWKTRSSVESLFEHEIEQSHVVLVDLPADGPIDWDKTVTSPSNNVESAEIKLDVARRKFAVGLIGARYIKDGGDEFERMRGTRDFCREMAGASWFAVSAYLAGVHCTRGRKSKGKGRFDEIWEKMPEQVVEDLSRKMKVPPCELNWWGVGSFFVGTAPEAIDVLGPQYAGDLIDTTLVICEFAHGELTGIVSSDPLWEFVDSETGREEITAARAVISGQKGFSAETRAELQDYSFYF